MAKTSSDALTTATANAAASTTTANTTTEITTAATSRGTASRIRGMAVACAAVAAITTIAYSCGGAEIAAGVLARGYGQALADIDTSWSSPQLGKAPANLWLSGLVEQPVAMRKAVAIGDRITVGNNSRTDVFEVVNLGQIDGEALGLQAMRIQVVTVRADGQPLGETVQFLFAVDELRPVPAQPKLDKVL